MQPANVLYSGYFEEANPGILAHAGTGQEILDLGCGTGALGEALKERGNRVTGVDLEPAAIERARSRLDEAYTADLNDPLKLPEAVRGRQFDVVVLSDVLEHLYDPWGLVGKVRGLLKPGGRLLVSVPNVATYPTRLAFLFGRFRYADSGTLDRTHVRFFTAASARAMFRTAGYRIAREDATPNFARVLLPLIKWYWRRQSETPAPPDAIRRSPAYQRYMRCVYPVERAVARLWKSLFAFQLIYVLEAEDEG